jgi:hypothetical protein
MYEPRCGHCKRTMQLIGGVAIEPRFYCEACDTEILADRESFP